MTDKAVDVVVSGRVQGVGYRWSCQIEADRLGVTGWVRNDDSGTVSGHFEGGADAVDALLNWCRQGPPGSRVTGVEHAPGTVEGATRFRVTY